jgi:hypothetical protein
LRLPRRKSAVVLIGEDEIAGTLIEIVALESIQWKKNVLNYSCRLKSSSLYIDEKEE